MSPTILNKVVDAVVPVTLREVFGPQEALHGLEWAEGEQYIVFYIDNGRIVGRNPISVQGTLTTLVWMSERVGIYMNLGKTKSMTCAPRFIWRQMLKEENTQRATGEGATFW